jgi:hypothetical protein
VEVVRFEPRGPRSGAILREQLCNLQLKKDFFYLFWAFLAVARKPQCWRPLALGLCAGGWTPASTETICADTRSLAGAPPASKDPFYLPVQIVCA